MDALLLVLSFWSSTQICLLHVDFHFSGLGFYSACLASLLFDILCTKLTLVSGFSALWIPLLIPLWHWLPMIRPGMDILFPVQVLTYHTTHLPSLFLWILSFHPIWVLTPHTRLRCLRGYPLHPYHLIWPTMAPWPLSWMPVLRDLTGLLFE